MISREFDNEIDAAVRSRIVQIKIKTISYIIISSCAIMIPTTTICLLFVSLIGFADFRIISKDPREALAFRVIHINDIHAHYDQINEILGRCNVEQAEAKQCYGGVARVKTAVDEIRHLQPEMDSIFLNAGDYYQVTKIRLPELDEVPFGCDDNVKIL